MIKKIFHKGKGLLILLLALSCTPSNYISVVDYRPGETVSNQAFIYALPQTVVRVDVDVVRSTYLHGPYARYAAQYLGIEKAGQQDSIHWKINGINIHTYQQADAGHIYSVRTGELPVSFQGLFTMTREGIILDLARQTDKSTEDEYIDELEDKGLVFTDLSLEGNLGIVKDTLYRLVFRDTAFVKTPLIQQKVQEKSVSKLANEAANYIFDIREARFFLITGDNSVLPDGEAMQASIDEMKRLEKEYLALFTGKTFHDTLSFSYEFIPTQSNEQEEYVMFRFSPKLGILPDNFRTGDVVALSLKALGSDLPVSEKPSPEVQNRVFYRMANPTEIKIKKSGATIAATRRLISQYGPVLGIPLNMMIIQE